MGSKDKLSLEEMLKLAQKIESWKPLTDHHSEIVGIKGDIDGICIYIDSTITNVRREISIQNANHDIIGNYKGFNRKLKKFLYDTISEIKNREEYEKSERIKKKIDYVRDLIE